MALSEVNIANNTMEGCLDGVHCIVCLMVKVYKVVLPGVYKYTSIPLALSRRRLEGTSDGLVCGP
jgi:hypothetical protein